VTPPDLCSRTRQLAGPPVAGQPVPVSSNHLGRARRRGASPRVAAPPVRPRVQHDGAQRGSDQRGPELAADAPKPHQRAAGRGDGQPGVRLRYAREAAGGLAAAPRNSGESSGAPAESEPSHGGGQPAANGERPAGKRCTGRAGGQGRLDLWGPQTLGPTLRDPLLGLGLLAVRLAGSGSLAWRQVGSLTDT
jgi:hypothetical protein